MQSLRLGLAASFCLAVGGCAAIDPTPYDPTLVAMKPALPVPMQFATFDQSAHTLTTLAQAYAWERNELISEKRYFDLPAVALGAAGIANVAFDGARAATLALGLSAATAYGTTSYFGVTSRITAYSTAARSLNCAADTSDEMNVLQLPVDAASKRSLDEALQFNIMKANSSLTDPSALPRAPTVTDKQNLLTAQNLAVTAAQTLEKANQILIAGPTELRVFANKLLQSTDDKVVSGSENTTQFMNTIQASVTQPATTSFPKVLAPPAGAGQKISLDTKLDRSKLGQSSGPTLAQLLALLSAETTQANAFAATVSTTWAALSACSASSLQG